MPLLFANRCPASPKEAQMDENVSVEELSVETLIEDVSIDGMCGVY